ncbi:SDR family oxidoreductase [Corynebacterium kutscheri]|uniref:Short-chain alcohol dehydrogenase n=1 Tax=Corynebacterium kutscheri TaxID=35755 RepID=A0A0F6R195_9CORY|nr:SDR family oxidoreductase [Corynebacterium kutscheri]AKE42197.1 short-chain alcohol dehydrogenase [Corynebacterium kutscheri]VEH10540.1 short chain dehydrogenase [Corynebacterium kutscheri]
MPRVLITGSSRGVGHALLSELISRNYEIIAHYCHQVPLEHPRVTHWQADFSNDAQPITPPDIDQLDALIHCAGVAQLGTIADARREVWHKHLAVNVLSPMELTAALLPALRNASGQVIYINSGAGQHTNPHWGAYSASKFAAKAFMDTLRQEEPSLRVTSIYPGRIDTDMQREIISQEGKTYDGSRFLRPETVAKAIIYALESPADAHIPDITIRPRG